MRRLLLFFVVILLLAIPTTSIANPIGHNYNKTEIESIMFSVTADSTLGETTNAITDELLLDTIGILNSVKQDSTQVEEILLDTIGVLNSVKTDSTNTVEIQGDTDALIIDLYSGVRVASTTEDFNQIVASYTLFTGTTADVLLESISLRNANVDCSDDATFTGISIETDDVTTTTFITQADGVIANLTAEAQIAWTGSAIIKSGTIIELSIYGAASDATCVADIIVTYRPLAATGSLVP